MDVVLTEKAQLDELPERSAVRSRYGLLAEKGPDGNWYLPVQPQPISPATLLVGGARVLDLGAWPDQPGYPSHCTGRADGSSPTPDELAGMLQRAVDKLVIRDDGRGGRGKREK